MEYERCVRKKLRSLFEYLDTDQDGKITSDCLLSGINKLQSGTSADLSNDDPFSILKDEKLYADLCEYEVEELIRCVPEADEKGEITLSKFLQSEETLLPKLSKLRLLQ